MTATTIRTVTAASPVRDLWRTQSTANAVAPLVSSHLCSKGKPGGSVSYTDTTPSDRATRILYSGTTAMPEMGLFLLAKFLFVRSSWTCGCGCGLIGTSPPSPPSGMSGGAFTYEASNTFSIPGRLKNASIFDMKEILCILHLGKLCQVP